MTYLTSSNIHVYLFKQYSALAGIQAYLESKQYNSAIFYKHAQATEANRATLHTKLYLISNLGKAYLDRWQRVCTQLLSSGSQFWYYLDQEGTIKGGASNAMKNNFPCWYPVQIRFRDLDPLAHVNNTVYCSCALAKA